MTDIIRSYIQDGVGLVQLGGLLVVVFVVLASWATTKSITKTLGTMVVGALVMGYLYNADWFGRKAASCVSRRGASPTAWC